MKKRLIVPITMALAVGLMGVFASSALATPSKTTPCSGCHDPLGTVSIAAVPVSVGSTSTTYQITVNNPLGINGWAVFNGSTKVAGTSGSGAQVILPVGATYTVFGVSGNGNGMSAPDAGYAQTSVTPAAAPAPPVPDTTAPTTTSDAVALYYLTATVHLSAHDNTGGSGVASTHYILDAGTDTTGTTITTSDLGTHTIEFWSVDTSGNVETHHLASFTVTSTPTAPATYTYTYKFSFHGKKYKNVKATLKNVTTGKKYTVKVTTKGVATFKNVLGGTYKLTATGNARFKFKAKTVKIGV